MLQQTSNHCLPSTWKLRAVPRTAPAQGEISGKVHSQLASCLLASQRRWLATPCCKLRKPCPLHAYRQAHKILAPSTGFIQHLQSDAVEDLHCSQAATAQTAASPKLTRAVMFVELANHTALSCLDKVPIPSLQAGKFAGTNRQTDAEGAKCKRLTCKQWGTRHQRFQSKCNVAKLAQSAQHSQACAQ